MNKTNKNTRVKITALATVLLMSLVAGCDSQSTSQGDEQTQPMSRPAKLLEVGISQTTDLISFPAIIQARQTSQLAFQVTGVIINLAVTEAMSVDEGDILAQLDPRDFQTKLDLAKAQFENADVEYQRALALINSNVISRSELAKRKADFEVTKSQLASANKALSDTTLRAPFSGRVAKVSVKNQESVQAGKAIFTLLSLSKLEATIDLPSNIIAHAATDKKSVTNSYVVLDAAPKLQIPATFKQASLEADLESQTYQVVFGFDAVPKLNILPGMSATLWMENPAKITNSQAIRVPLTAIGIDGKQTYVWVVDTKLMTVSKRLVLVANGVGEQLEIIDGLVVGDTIVSAGISSLSAGAVVRPWLKK